MIPTQTPKPEPTDIVGSIRQLTKEIQILTGGLKNDFAYSRKTKYQALEFKKVTATTTAQFIEFSEPVQQVTIALSQMGTATNVYIAIEGTAGTDGIELNANLRVLSFGDIPIKKISVVADVGTTTVVEAFGLRGG